LSRAPASEALSSIIKRLASRPGLIRRKRSVNFDNLLRKKLAFLLNPPLLRAGYRFAWAIGGKLLSVSASSLRL